jgi:D-glycero-D-manno-heptose 1,7-bisphosphate phosphatase
VTGGARAAFVDRDGVINDLVEDPASARPESPLRVEDVTLIPDAAAALRRLSQSGLLVVGVSNQPAAAKGKASLEQLMAIQERVVDLLAEQGARFDAFRICLHHPRGTDSQLTRRCDCRKPAPGMLLDAAQELGIDLQRSWMIGDTDADVQAGRAAGCRTALVMQPLSAHKRSETTPPDLVVSSLADAAQRLVKEAVD